MDPEFVPQTMAQKKMAFASSPHVEAVVQLLQECGGVPKLIGNSEFETVVNAATLDAQQNLITKFINTIDAIKQGSLVQSE
jgi:hypothetical protein